MKDTTKKLLESKNLDDFLLGMTFFYKEVGEEYFTKEMTEYSNSQGKFSKFMTVPFECNVDTSLFVRTPQDNIIHILSKRYWIFSQYLSENTHIKPPEYHFSKVFQL